MNIIRYFIPIILATGLIPEASSQERLYDNEFPLSDITLLDSPFSNAMNLNADVLLSYDTDRLLAPYLKAAGLEPKGESFSNWDGLDGHIGGHYLSALAIHYAATGRPEFKERMDYMLSQLSMCAVARGDGYVGGLPNGDPLWKAISDGNAGKVWDYWVPWYNIHKIYAGLRDSWVYADSKVGLNLFLGMCDWGIKVIANLTDQQMESMLDCEFGGMNEVYADAYAITGDKKYLDAARRFTHHQLFDDMLRGTDNLDNRHANTQVPKVVGFQRIAELASDEKYDTASRFFWETVVNNRSLSIGGNSRREHFASKADAKSYVDEREGPETCNTNNMLKLTEGLFRMSPEARYADFYERALYNHILSSQHPEHGGYVYFTSARPGHYRVYSKPNCAMWCCVGTGMENHGKYGQFIYTHKKDSLWVNLFIPSVLDWKSKGVKLTQHTSFPENGNTKITVNVCEPTEFSMRLRHPAWSDNVMVKVNGKQIKTNSGPSSYIELNRKWSDGDIVEMEMPMKFTIEELNYLPDYISILRGPIVMAARYDNGTPLKGLIADDHRWAHIAGGELVSVFDTPILIGKRSSLLKKLNSMQPVNGKTLTYSAENLFDHSDRNIEIEPFYRIHDSRYIMYWLSMTPQKYARYRDNARKDEAKRLALDKRTVDAVNTGEQQPEADHFMELKSSSAGNFNGEPWRASSDGGYFSYKMKTDQRTDLSLRLRYWGNETGNRKFDIFIDDQLIASEDTANKWKTDEFVEIEYEIPPHIVKDKQYITVKFSGERGQTAGGIFHVRLIHP
ncbi:MAG: glycoside hydrolase family 127 protein [Duncaniella sp.]|nr:glycoside hydrolase family 127 protein [Duncaniella sp.]